MSLDDYNITEISEDEEKEVRRHFLNLIHSGKRYDAIKYYQKLKDSARKCIEKDSSGKWELMNSFTELEA